MSQRNYFPNQLWLVFNVSAGIIIVGILVLMGINFKGEFRMEKSILVVDDSDFMHKMYKLTLSKSVKNKYKTIHAYDGKAALELVQTKNEIDAVFLDINMPLISGIDFLKIVKTSVPHFTSPIIVITTEKSENDISLAKDLGAKSYITKPFIFTDLLTELDRVIAEFPRKSA